MMVKPTRGLTSLRTLAGRSSKQVPAYKAYLQVSFLELERARHKQEIGTVRQRLDRMVDRCLQIDTEKAAILASAGQTGSTVIATPGAVRTLSNGRRRFGVSY